jgi:nicotinamide mononucleotide transporter
MEKWPFLLDINQIAFNIIGYPLSYVELIGTFFGLICVWLAAKDNIFTWPTGVINIVCFFSIFYQIGLYSDMFLQIYFLGVAIYGWFNWRNEHRSHVPLSNLKPEKRILLTILTIALSLIVGYGMTKIHLFLPSIFKKPAAFAYLDTFIAVASVIANVLLAKRIVENWIMWIIIDVVAVYVYYQKGILFISLEYFIYLGIAWYGYQSWNKEMSNN